MPYESKLSQFRSAGKKPALPQIVESTPEFERGIPVKLTRKKADSHTIFYQEQLDKDKLRLSAIDDIPTKIELKKELVKNYEGLIKAFLAGNKAEKSIVAEIMVWLFDVGDIENALLVAFGLIDINQPMPDKFDSKTTIKIFVCRAIGEWARPLLKSKSSASPYLDWVAEKIESDSWDLPEALASEIFMLMAKFKKELADWQGVVDFVNKAEKVNPDGFGGKTIRNEALKELKKA